MWKTRILVVILIAFSLMLVSCNAMKTTSVNNGEVSNSMAYGISSANYTVKDIKINYPQITNLSDAKKQKSINEIIKNEALKVLNYYKEEQDNIPSELSLDIKYDIKWQGEDLLSIQYSGIGYNKGAAHPNNLFYTTNINMRNGSRVKLIDVINIDESFIDKIKKGKFQVTDPKAVDKSEIISAQNSFSKEELIKTFENADSLDSVGTENQSDIFSYFTKDSLGISVNVSHAAGDHAELEMKYKDISDSIKTGNEIWKDF